MPDNRTIMLEKFIKYVEKRKKEGDDNRTIWAKIQKNKARWNLIPTLEKQIIIFRVLNDKN